MYLNKYERMKKEIMKLFNVFFYGDTITEYEKKIERRYLAEKQKKWYKFQANKKNVLSQCLWTYNNQKCIEGMINWRTRDLNLFDDFRSIYEVYKIK